MEIKKQGISLLWVMIASILGVSTIVEWIVVPEFPWVHVTTLVLSVGIFSLLGFIYRGRLRAFFQRRFVRLLFTNIITIFLTFSITGILSYLVYKNSKRYDFTNHGVHELTEQTKTVLASLKAPLSMTLFAKRESWKRYLDLLHKYGERTDLMDLKVVDIDLNPALVKLKGIEENGTLLMEYEGKSLQSVLTNELDLTNQIIKIQRHKEISIYYSIGHGELDFYGKKEEGGHFLFQKLKNSNYKVKPLDTLTSLRVPKDADVLIVLGAETDFLQLEITQLRDFLERGGNLLVSIKPLLSHGRLENLYGFIEHYMKVKILNSLIIDRLASVEGMQASIPIVTHFDTNHVITKEIKGRALFPLSTGLMIEKQEGEDQGTLLAMSSSFPGSWAETDLKGLERGSAAFDEEDLKGPLPLMFSLEKKSMQKFLLFASSAFVTNGYRSQSTNFNLFLNSIAWMTGDQGIISFHRPELEKDMILMPASELQLIFFFVIIILPFSLFILGILFYRKGARG